MKRNFFQTVTVSILVYECTTWTPTKRIEKKEECCALSWTNPGNSTPEKRSCTATYLLYHKPFKLDRTRHAGQCWRSKGELETDELETDVLLDSCTWTCQFGWPAKTYLNQLCTDIRCSLEDLPGAIDDCEGWRERERERENFVLLAWFDDDNDDNDDSWYIKVVLALCRRCNIPWFLVWSGLALWHITHCGLLNTKSC